MKLSSRASRGGGRKTSSFSPHSKHSRADKLNHLKLCRAFEANKKRCEVYFFSFFFSHTKKLANSAHVDSSRGLVGGIFGAQGFPGSHISPRQASLSDGVGTQSFLRASFFFLLIYAKKTLQKSCMFGLFKIIIKKYSEDKNLSGKSCFLGARKKVKMYSNMCFPLKRRSFKWKENYRKGKNLPKKTKCSEKYALLTSFFICFRMSQVHRYICNFP